jgi:hypothetical protein
MSFNRKTCKALLSSSALWKSIDELWEAVRNTEGVIDEDFIESALEKAGKQELRSVLNEEDPETGLPLAASLIGEDGERRYKPTQLFDDSDYRKVINDRYKRFTNMAREIRHWEQVAGIPPSEQLSLDLSWIDAEEEAA